jgi:hypothetical protein
VIFKQNGLIMPESMNIFNAVPPIPRYSINLIRRPSLQNGEENLIQFSRLLVHSSVQPILRYL